MDEKSVISKLRHYLTTDVKKYEALWVPKKYKHFYCQDMAIMQRTISMGLRHNNIKNSGK